MKSLYKALQVFTTMILLFSTFQTKSQCVANFNYSINANGNVSFFSTSTNTTALTNFQWNFGNGNFYSNVGVAGMTTNTTYTNNGTYVVILTIAQSAPSCSNAIGYTININNICNLNANLSMSQGASGLVNFFNTSTGTSSTTTYSINYGTGATSSIVSAFNYSVPGNYTVTLTATNSGSCISTYTTPLVVCPSPPSFAYSVGTNGQVQFTNTTWGANPSNTYTLYTIGASPAITSGVNFGIDTVTYNLNGAHSVTLVIGNTNCGTMQSFSLISVNTVTTPCNLVPSFTYVPSSNGLVTFNSTSTGTNANTSFNWQFGNGSSGSGISSAAVYTSNGTYVATLNVNNNSLPVCTGQSTLLVNVTNVTNPCTLNANFTYTTGANGSVQFASNSTGTVSNSLFYWTIGSYTAFSSATSYTFPANGSYTVQLYVDNQASPMCTSLITQTINITNVSNPCPLIAGFTYTFGTNGSVFFSSTSAGTNSNTSFNWMFGNGQTGNTPNTSTTYTSNGIYVVKLVIVNTLNPSCNDTIAQMLNVTNAGSPCNLNANYSHTVGAAGQVTFVSTSTGTVSNTVYIWNFGDGTTAFGINPVHVYPSSGAYFVTLSAINNSVNCTSTSSAVINVTGINCVANSNFSMTPTPTPQVWNAIPSFPWNVSNAIWSWGDGSTSNGLYSSHSYSAAGNYQICLSVTVSCASSASTCTTYSVYKTSSANAIIQINVVPPQLIEVGVNEADVVLNELNFYPNPSNGALTIELPSKSTKPIRIQVIDLSGKCVYFTSMDSSEDLNSKNLELQHLPNGVYILQFKQADRCLNKKLVIAKD